jgi:muconolactone delta-isomerase
MKGQSREKYIRHKRQQRRHQKKELIRQDTPKKLSEKVAAKPVCEKIVRRGRDTCYSEYHIYDVHDKSQSDQYQSRLPYNFERRNVKFEFDQ